MVTITNIDTTNISVLDIKYPDTAKLSKDQFTQGMITYLGMVTNVDMKNYFDNAPSNLVINSCQKESLFVIGDLNSIHHCLSYFPFAHYKITGFLTEKECFTFIGMKHFLLKKITLNKAITASDKVLILSNDLVCNLEIPEEKIIPYKWVKIPKLGTGLRISFGHKKLSKDLICITPELKTGLIWHLVRVSTINMIAKCIDCSVFVDMQNFNNSYISPAEIGWYNPWNYYFKQPSTYNLDELYNCENIIMFKIRAFDEKAVFDRSWISDHINKKEQLLYNQIFKAHSNVLGVFLRGTDYKIAPWHSIPYDPYEAIEVIKKYMVAYNLDYIFLNTEDEDNFEVISNYFNDKVLSMDRARYKSVKNLPFDATGSQNNFKGLKTGEDYLIETLLISRSSGIIHTQGSSIEAMKHFSSEYLFFDGVLSKVRRNDWGSTPIIIESHNKNMLCINDNIKVNDEFIIKYGELGDISVSGHADFAKNICVSEFSPFFVNRGDVCYFSVNYLKNEFSSLNFIFELKDVNEKISIMPAKSLLVFDKRYVAIKVIFLTKPGDHVDCRFTLQIEHGALPSEYEPYRYSESYIACLDEKGIYYNSKYLQSIDCSTGIMKLDNHDLLLNMRESKLLNNYVKFENGFTIFNISGVRYDSLKNINCNEICEFSKAIDEEWFYDICNNFFARVVTSRIINALFCSSDPYHNFVACNICLKIKDKTDLICMQLGRAYRDGVGVKKNIDLAKKWMKKAVNLNYDSNIYEYTEILKLLDNKQTIIESDDNGSELLSKNNRMYILANVKKYRDGIGVEKDLNKAAEWYAKISDDPAVASDYFDLLWQIGTDDAYEEMIKVVKKSAQCGFRGSMIRLGRAYRDGVGVKKDLNKAAELMKKTISYDNSNNWTAEIMDILEKIGTEKSLKERFQIALNLAEIGDQVAINVVGQAYYMGIGVEKDLNKAAEWHKKCQS